MTPTVPIPTSIADACAAHDRHRLDVLDALLDEAAPSAVRELLGAALDLCASLRADLASERAHLAACQTRIAGLESAANERSAEVARLTARVAELEARPVLTEAKLHEAWGEARGGAYMVPDIMRHLGPVMLPAQDRAEELTQAIHGTPREEVNPAIWRGMVERTRSALATLGAPPTSPPAARPVFAGVSASDLDVAYIGGQRECHRRHEGAIKDCCRYAAVAAVLARLEVSLVAPVDLAAIERAMKAYHNASGEHAVPADALGTGQWRAAVLAMTDAFLAAGIPITPEVGK